MKNHLPHLICTKELIIPLFFIPVLLLLLSLSWSEYMDFFEAFLKKDSALNHFNWKALR